MENNRSTSTYDGHHTNVNKRKADIADINKITGANSPHYNWRSTSDTSNKKQKVATESNIESIIYTLYGLIATGEHDLFKCIYNINATELCYRSHIILHRAISLGSVEICKFLLEKNTNPNDRSAQGTSIQVAIENKNTDLLSMLIAFGADIYMKTNKGYSYFHLAAICNYVDGFKILMNKNSTSEKIPIDKLYDSSGRTPIHYAVNYGSFQIVDYLLTVNTNYINTVDVFGRTPLMDSILTQCEISKALDKETSVNALLSKYYHHIDFFVSDNRKQNIFHYLAILNNDILSSGSICVIMNMLKQRIVHNLQLYSLINQRDIYGLTPMFISKIYGNIVLPRMFLGLGGDAIPDLKLFYDIKRLKCPICSQTIYDPIIIKCGHCFCRQCIQPLNNKPDKCKICQNTIDFSRDFMICRLIKKIIKKLYPEEYTNRRNETRKLIYHVPSVLTEDHQVIYHKRYLANIHKLSNFRCSNISLDADNKCRILPIDTDINSVYARTVTFYLDYKNKNVHVYINILTNEPVNSDIAAAVYMYILTTTTSPDHRVFFTTGNYLCGGTLEYSSTHTGISVQLNLTFPLHRLNNDKFMVSVYNDIYAVLKYHVLNIKSIMIGPNHAHTSIIAKINQINMSVYQNIPNSDRFTQKRISDIIKNSTGIKMINGVTSLTLQIKKVITTGTSTETLHIVCPDVFIKHNKQLNMCMVIVKIGEHNGNVPPVIKTDIGTFSIMKFDYKKYLCLYGTIDLYYTHDPLDPNCVDCDQCEIEWEQYLDDFLVRLLDQSMKLRAIFNK